MISEYILELRVFIVLDKKVFEEIRVYFFVEVECVFSSRGCVGLVGIIVGWGVCCLLFGLLRFFISLMY